MYRAILIDDEVVAVNALSKRIAWKNYEIDEVLIAHSMKQAQLLFKSTKIDLMLCDIEMPNGSGLELFEWVKTYFPWVECIFVSCHPDYQYIRQALKLGSFDYVLKPVDYIELHLLLEQVFMRIKQKENSHRKLPVGDVHTSEEIESNQSLDGMSITDETVLDIRQYIEANLINDICINDIAEAVHLNAVYVMRLFKAKMNSSIVEYITNLRIERAKELLLKTALPVQRVAEEVGYGNYSYFARLFKKKIKMTPIQYRNSKNS